jgi:hypothetical protein
MSERQGVEIDYCPQCRGVWLDRGELDKLIERSTREFERDDDDEHRPARGSAPPSQPHGGQRPQKKSFWRELLDFD